jgi:hypothetical protein
MPTNLPAECKDPIKDSDLIQLRYRGCIAKQNPVPAPRIWQRTPKKNQQTQADAAPTIAHQPACPQLVDAQTGIRAQLSDDEWSRQFLFLVNVRESGQKRHSSPSLDGDREKDLTVKTREY